MNGKNLYGTIVLDKNVREVGKVDDIEFNTETGKIESVMISLKKGLLSNEIIEIDFDDIETFGDYVLLSNEIETEEKIEKPEVTIEVEDE